MPSLNIFFCHFVIYYITSPRYNEKNNFPFILGVKGISNFKTGILRADFQWGKLISDVLVIVKTSNDFESLMHIIFKRV